MLTGQTVLIVEEEFLIALDIQRVLEILNAKQTVFARNVDEAMSLADKWSDFGIALVELHHRDTQSLDLVRGLQDAGTCLVLTSCDITLRHGAPGLPDTPVVIKPFMEEDLASAVQRALAQSHGMVVGRDLS